MRGILLNLVASSLIASASVAAPSYHPDVTKWEEVKRPAATDSAAAAVWEYAAGYSEVEWYVFMTNGEPRARLEKRRSEGLSDKLNFVPRAGRLSTVSDCAEVDDGWLVGFNQGEFGAALYWFSKDGKRNYRISHHQIVKFFLLPAGLHAIEGLAHLGVSRGSVIRISRRQTNDNWRATTVVKLPQAPDAVSVRQDGTMLITLSDSLVAVDSDQHIHTLLADPRWRAFYPVSSVLARDESKLYLGMRQFVGEFDLNTRKLRFLIPNKQFLNQLPKEEENRIRLQYSGKSNNGPVICE